MDLQNVIHNLSTIRGDTIQFGFEIVGYEGDLTSAYFSVKKETTDEEYSFQKSLGDGIEKIDTGKWKVRVSPEDTEDLPTGTYYYDLQIGVPNGNVNNIYTILKGKFNVTYDVTRV